MSKTMKRTIFSLLAVAAAAAALRLAAQVTCTLTKGTFTESFLATTYKDTANTAVNGWAPATGLTSPIELPWRGANFGTPQIGAFGGNVYVAAAGDFNGDGVSDVVGYEVGVGLVLFLNNGGSGTWTTKVLDASHTAAIAAGSVCTGDFNNDGLLDFFFMRNDTNTFTYTNFSAAMYLNNGTTAAPSFAKTDLTTDFQNNKRPIYCDWPANHLCAVDIDKDGDAEILVISQDKIFLVNRAPKGAKWQISELSYNQNTGFVWAGGGTNRGGSCIGAADFDGDGNIDIVCGSVNGFDHLVYYKNDGMMGFTRQVIQLTDPNATGPVGLGTRDFTGDGRPDIIAVTGGPNTSHQAHMWMLSNGGVNAGVVSFSYQSLNGGQPVIPPTYDAKIALSLDFDHDGDYDLLLGDSNAAGTYYLVPNNLANVFSLYGKAQSTNVLTGTLDPRLTAITSVRPARLTMNWRGSSNAGLKVSLYFSSNGGVNWELYNTWAGGAISTISFADPEAGWYEFKNFGTDLRWRIILEASEDVMPDLTGASFSTPQVFNLAIEYKYVSRQEYSRSSAAATIVTSSGETKKLILGASFVYPGWEGQLRAYDVTKVSIGTGGQSTLTTLTSSDLGSATGRTIAAGTTIFWDAGQLLATRSADDRTIYTAVRAGSGQPLQRTDFTVANVSVLTPFLQDPQGDDDGLIGFIRGTGREWKLGDINHSTPVVVGPPSQVASQMGADYADFQHALENRAKVVYVGANDGMLHCFNVTTGAELWAFIPYNLLPKLQKQWAVDTINGTRYFAHDIFVDGSPSVADVQIAGQWRTVLVCGQGPGKGSTMAGGTNYYFALDITDPLDPRPLWEISPVNSSGQYTMGESWSTPVIGRITDGGTSRWVAFMGSGYDNIGQGVAGRTFYAVRIDTGQVIWESTVADVDTSLLTAPRVPYPNILASIVASPTAVDTNADGMVNDVYAADLDGRLYRLDTTSSLLSNWTFTAIYTDYQNYPIITKPAVWIDPYAETKYPKVYFGTGGDDNAPAAREYSFVGLTDMGASGVTVDWYLGNPTALNLPSDKKQGDLEIGYKVWADPVVTDFTVYFSTLRGSIENVNPCLNLTDAGRLYARQLRVASGIPVGGSALRSGDIVPPEYLQMVSKARKAVTVGEIQRTPAPESISKREVFIQEYNSTIEMLANPVAALLQIKSWREVYQIIR